MNINDTVVEIKEAIYTPPSRTINKITITMFDYKLGSRARFRVSLFEDESVVHNEFLVLEGDDFLAWSSDDTYIESWVLNKLGYQKASA